MLVDRISHRFQRRPIDMRSGVAAFQTEQHSGGLRVLNGAALSVNVRQHHQSFAAGGDTRGFPCHNAVSIRTAGKLLRILLGVKCVSDPAGQGAGGIGAIAQAEGSGNRKLFAALDGTVAGLEMSQKTIHTVIEEHG